MDKSGEFWNIMDELKKFEGVEKNAEKSVLISQAKEEFNKYLDIYNEFDRNLNNLLVVFDTAFDSPLVESVWKMNEIALKYFSEKFGIDKEAITWFVYDNEQGKNKFETNNIPIENVDDFILMELGIQYTLKNGKVVYLGDFDLKKNILSYSVLPEVTEKEGNEISKMLNDALKNFAEQKELRKN